MLYGLDRVPAMLPGGEERLPGVSLTPAPLRLGTVPMPPDRFPQAATHVSRMAAVAGWLTAAAGDYNRKRHRFIALYMDFVAAHLRHHHDELARILQPFHGLYELEDWGFAALRPLPRAWLPVAAGLALADFAFWDGRQLIAVLLGDAAETDLAAAGHVVCRLSAADLQGEPEDVVTRHLPANLRHFWTGERLPLTPFRRSLAGVVAV